VEFHLLSNARERAHKSANGRLSSGFYDCGSAGLGDCGTVGAELEHDSRTARAALQHDCGTAELQSALQTYTLNVQYLYTLSPFAFALPINISYLMKDTFYSSIY